VKRTRSTLSGPWSRRAVVFATLLALFVAVAPAAAQATPTDSSAARTSITIDFSTVTPDAPFDQSSFNDDGIVFTGGSFVGFFQGDNALTTDPVGPIAGKVRGGFRSVSMQVSPGFQGTATYTLTAFKHGEEVATTSLTVTQIQGDPTSDPLGYFTININSLPKKADSFSLSNVFVSSPNPDATTMPFGVSSITVSG
jgi:hypothetical protein